MLAWSTFCPYPVGSRGTRPSRRGIPTALGTRSTPALSDDRALPAATASVQIIVTGSKAAIAFAHAAYACWTVPE
jgi:hypothetical protein